MEKIVELKINGKEVSLNAFVQKVLRNVNLGIINALKIEAEELMEIEIRIVGE